MNNKGFGIGILFVFIILIFFSFISFYMFINSAIKPILYPQRKVSNYKNEYKIYLRNHQITLNKKLS